MNTDVCNILFIQQTHFKCSTVYSSSLQAVQKYKDTLQARKSISSQHASFPSTLTSHSETKSFSELALGIPGIYWIQTVYAVIFLRGKYYFHMASLLVEVLYIHSTMISL